MSTTILPPDLPENAVYTRCYCEENIYLLCRDFLSKPEIAEKWNLWVLFVSNENKMAALFFQKSSRREDLPVLWDYHVILILQPRVDSDLDERRELRGNASWAYDFDTRLPIPCPWEDYLEMTFPKDLLTEYESCFRVIPAEVYLKNFASDRSHMIVETPGESVATYSSPPPVYEPIFGEVAAGLGVKTNLMRSFVNMKGDEDTFGTVYSRKMIERVF